MPYRCGQAEDRLLGDQALCKLNVILEIWKVLDLDSNLQTWTHDVMFRCFSLSDVSLCCNKLRQVMLCYVALLMLVK